MYINKHIYTHTYVYVYMCVYVRVCKKKFGSEGKQLTHDKEV